jgi:aminoglycoside phosphotransferase family enzyme
MIAPVQAVTGWAGEPWAAVAETHSAVVFFAGDQAWKLKKPGETDEIERLPR